MVDVEKKSPLSGLTTLDWSPGGQNFDRMRGVAISAKARKRRTKRIQRVAPASEHVADAGKVEVIFLVFAAAAGLLTGIAFDLFVLCALTAPMFLCVLLVCARSGVVGALLVAIATTAILQLSYLVGLLARGNLTLPRIFRAARSQERGK